ncbi:hypothetical protein [Legionella cardiaca]|uniref:Uncharacterized protein n=1 Tax=Legionella cardiaca TaxID=1071983 RepID=A0ABY8AX24_9GAMM|nr:hypothetical protein [Legionella cardiaca]WED43986.1 hypothetical protein PXX05_04155 [Legionella cardiaca]
MKKSSQKSVKDKTKETIKNENLKNISGGRVHIPELPDPSEIRRILDERRKR